MFCIQILSYNMRLTIEEIIPERSSQIEGSVKGPIVCVNVLIWGQVVKTGRPHHNVRLCQAVVLGVHPKMYWSEQCPCTRALHAALAYLQVS